MSVDPTDPMFHDEDAARAYFEAQRWPDGKPVCPHCHSENVHRLEGASHRMIFFTIVAPMAAEGIAAAWLLVLVLCWNEYLLATSLVTSGAMTLPVWLEGQMSIKEAQIGAEAEELANFSAVATLMILPLIAFAGVAQRVITRRSTWKA